MPKLLAVLVAALALAPSAGAYAVFPRFGELASHYAGRPVEVRCYDLDEWRVDFPGLSVWGYTRFKGDEPQYVALAPTTCLYVLWLVVDPNDKLATKLNGPWTRVEMGRGLLALLHESFHMTGDTNESRVECRAVEALPSALDALGARGAVRESVLAAALAFHRQLPAVYQGGC